MYLVKGVGGSADVDIARRYGANSFRTWGVERAEEDLEIARQTGVTVMLGYWMPHVNHGFDYTDEVAVAEVEAEVLETVERFKDHPNLLAWALGNEMEIHVEDPEFLEAIFTAINRIALKVMEIDPYHPVTTVIAGPGLDRLEAIRDFAPDLDFIGINAYGNTSLVPRNMDQVGLTMPYMLTEFGAQGQWDIAITPWGTPLEETSTQKGLRKRHNYQVVIEEEANRALGSYAFLWITDASRMTGWFSMRSREGEKLEALDQMIHAWTGDYPHNRAPQILYIDSRVQGNYVLPGQEIEVRVGAVDPEGDPLSYTWELRWEDEYVPDDLKRKIEAADEIPERYQSMSGDIISFEAPDTEGPYKLVAYVRDGRGNLATATVHFYVAQA